MFAASTAVLTEVHTRKKSHAGLTLQRAGGAGVPCSMEVVMLCSFCYEPFKHCRKATALEI